MPGKEAKEIADALLSVLEERGFISKPVKWESTPVRPERPIQEWKGNPPMKDEKYVTFFKTQEPCNLNDGGGPCKEFLSVVRVKNVVKGKDELRGQLIYDDGDARYFYFCARHGPSTETLSNQRW